MNRQRMLPITLMVASFGLLMALVLLRVNMVNRVVGSTISCSGCFNLPVIQADLVLFSLLAALLLAGGLLRPVWLGRAMHGLIAMLLLVYICDLSIMHLFGLRLFLSDAALFISEPAAIWNQFSTRLGWQSYAVATGVVFLFLILPLLPPVRARSQRIFLLAVLLLSMTASKVVSQQSYVNAWAVDNVFVANLATSERVRYSVDEAARILARTPPARVVQSSNPAISNLRANVTIVIVESWSSWHSQLFGGFENWTPQLDAAASSGLRFENFHSIGFATANGLVGILAGQQIWSPFLNWFETPPFHSNWGLQRSLPKVFAEQDYRTAFLTSGPIDLTNKGQWTENLGFGLNEGNEHPYYADLPRYALGAATDQALYGRALEWQQAAPGPYLLVLETVSSHQPYTDPVSGQNSQELAMKYSDQAFGEYLLALRATAYFEQGILLVVSDHRSMTPMPFQEIEALGPDAHSRVPAFILGNHFTADSVAEGVYSQADLIPTFEWWLSGSAQLQPMQAIMFGQNSDFAAEAQQIDLNCAFHVRGDVRGWVEVICNRGRGQVKLDGDQTRFITKEGLDDLQQAHILDWIGHERLEGMRRHELWVQGAQVDAAARK